MLLLLFEIFLKIWPFVCKTVNGFSGSAILRNQLFKVSCSCSFLSTRLQKMHHFFVEKCLKISQNLKIDRYVMYFSPYLKIGLFDLFPVLLECITYLCTLSQNTNKAPVLVGFSMEDGYYTNDMTQGKKITVTCSHKTWTKFRAMLLIKTTCDFKTQLPVDQQVQVVVIV